VREGFEDRAASIESQMGRLGLNFEYMLEGDMVDLDDRGLERWFSGYMRNVHPMASCSTKHLLCYEKVAREEWPAVLILEDDALLADAFVQVVEGAAAEIDRDHRPLDPWYISLENSGLRFVPVADRRPGTFLYSATTGRCAGGYMVNLAMAKMLLAAAEGGGLSVQIDTFIDQSLPSDDVQAFWCEPPVVEQGSHSGVFTSSLVGHERSLSRRIGWAIRKMLRRVKYRLM